MFPIVPSLTLVAALTCTRLTINAHKNAITKLLLSAAVISTLVTAFISHAILLPLSAQNYPGGQALEALHQYYHENREGFISIWEPRTGQPEIHVHLTNFALQSGVTRFLEQPVQSELVPGEPISPVVGSTPEPHVQKRDPLILPGDADHPALTVRPKAPSPSSSSLLDKRLFRHPLWVYDKSGNDTAFLTPEFWSQFDFLVVEDPSLAIGAWEIVHEIKGLGQPGILKPEMTRTLRYWKSMNDSNIPDSFWQRWTTGDQADIEAGGTTALLHAMYPPLIAVPLVNLHNIAHDIIVCGYALPHNILSYWFEVPLETKLYILQQTTSGMEPNKGQVRSSDRVRPIKKVTSSVATDATGEHSEEVPALPDKATTDQTPLDFNRLGPLVVNKDGTLSRLDNWAQMNAQERKKTVEYLRKRNMIRMEGAEAVAQ